MADENVVFIMISISFLTIALYLLMGGKWSVLQKPHLFREAGVLIPMGIFAPWFFLLVAHVKNAPLIASMQQDTIFDAALMIFPPVFLVIGGMTYYAVIEYFKESNIYQETFIEGEGRQSSRWGSIRTYLARDISAYFRNCKKQIVRTRESPIYLGRTMWQYDFRLFGHRDIGLISEQHLLTISGSGGGKSRDAVFNNLLSYCGGVCAFSTKNEHVQNTFAKRAMYSPTYVIDPWDKTSVGTAYWNPLNEIDINNPNARGRLGRLAQAILPKEGNTARAVDEHFREIPKKILRGYIVHVMTKYPKEQQHLGTVYDLLIKGKVDGGNDYDPMALETVILDMAKNGAVGGSPSEAAKLLAELSGSEKSGMLSSLSRAIDWVNDPIIRKNIVEKSSFQMSELKEFDATCYLVIPEYALMDQMRYLRLFYQSMIDTLDENVTEQPAGSNRRVLMLFDEFEALGHFETARQAALRKRASHIKCWFILQNYEQLVSNYSNPKDFMGNCDKQIFGIDRSDTEFMKMLSESLGAYTTYDHSNQGQMIDKSLLSSGDLEKFMNAARGNQLVIPVQGYPMRLKRVPYWKNFGRKFKN